MGYTSISRGEQTTLKDLQRNAMYLSTQTKKQFSMNLHAVELPLSSQALHDRNATPLCMRFFDDMVREVGSHILVIPNNASIADILAEAKRQLRPEWSMSGVLRLLEVADGRLMQLHRSEASARSLICLNKANIFYNSVRVEVDTDLNIPAGSTLIEVFHCDRNSQQAFAQPLLMTIGAGETAKNIKNRIRSKLNVPEQEF